MLIRGDKIMANALYNTQQVEGSKVCINYIV